MKISLIGTGRVGSTLAYTLLLRGIGDELVLVNRTRTVAEGEALDLQHAESFTNQPVSIRAGELADTAGSDVLIVSSSVPWNPKQTSRFDMGRDNLRIFQQIIPPLAAASPEAKVLVVSNPVDVMTYHTIRLTGFGPDRVFGSGTLIDSGRFRRTLSAKVGIHPDDVRAYILGEHGDSQFAGLSHATAGGSRIVIDDQVHRISEEAKNAGAEVMKRKGHTNFAVSLAAAMAVGSIAWDSRRTIPLSVLVDGFLDVHDVCLSLPVVVGSAGITQVLRPELDEDEAAAFRRCARLVRQAIDASMA